MSSPRNNLGTPRQKRRQLVPVMDAESFGRLAEGIARFLGTSRFLVVQTVLVILWISYNVIAVTAVRFDKYPFILLNLAFSTQAAYAAPLILLAQNRQDDRDRANLLEDRDRALRSLADTEFLARELADIRLSLGEVVTRDYLRNELRELLADLDGAADGTGRRDGTVRRREGTRREGKGGKKKKNVAPAGETVVDAPDEEISREAVEDSPVAHTAPGETLGGSAGQHSAEQRDDR